ncbi:MAG: transcription elongation factor GreB [Myxococcota bacterium]
MSGENIITKRGLAKLINEIHWLQKVERPKITAEVSYAASLGDRSENAEYIYGKKRLREIDARLRYLIGRLSRITEVDPALQGERAKGKIMVGATVVIEDHDGEERTYRIYGEDEVNVRQGILSWKSPIARALLGAEAGDEVSYQAPSGLRSVEVIDVSYHAQDALPEDDLEAWKLP